MVVLLGQVAIVLTLVFFAILRKLYICNARLKKKSTSSLQRIGPSTANKDFISELPDDILTSIIERLTIKSAIRMSLLSQRWRNLHRLVTNIDLDCGLLVDDYEHMPHDSKLIIDSVDRFLRLWNGSKIRTFRLSCCLNKSATRRLKQCIYSLGRMGIEKLILTTCCPNGDYSDLSFSCHLLSEIPSLRHFQLSLCILRPSLKSQCNSIKIIYLSYVTLLPGAIECVLSSCLRLENLAIYCCESPSKLSFRGSHLQLKLLNIHYCTGVKEIDLYAGNLVMFEFMTTEDVDLDVNSLFKHVPQLENVYLDICEKYSVPYVCRKLSKGLPNLKSLSLVTGGGDIYQGSSRLMGINMFSSLRQLNLEVYSTTRVDLLLLTQLLQSCPLLQDFGLHTDIPEYVLPQQKKPVVFHSELKKVEFSGFIGTKNDIELALYILKSATCLEEMLISRYFKMYNGYGSWLSRYEDPWSEETQRMIQEQLQGQTVSMDARVIIQLEPHVEDVEDDYD